MNGKGNGRGNTLHVLTEAIKDMKRYYFVLMDSDYNDLGALIPDGSSKQTAANRAKRWMKENNVTSAQLQVNSMITDNLLEFIDIEL